MDYRQKILYISNSYYNVGLERANIRDLTGAADSLKKSLHFNKYHTDSRNLLGLIYYEMGEVAEALVQWVISMNLQPENNRAEFYLTEVQGKPAKLEVESGTIKRFNQALIHAKNGSDDLAVLQLKKVIDANPNFVKAHLLLAILYMAREDYTKAGRSLLKVLQIDKNNPKALWYMSIVKENTGKAEIERNKLKNAFSHRQMQDDDIIIPPSYKENTGWQSILNIMAGLLLGAVVVFFLVMPANTKALNNRHNQEMLRYSDMLNDRNRQIEELTATVSQLEAKNKEAEDSLASIAGDNGSVLNQYQTLVGILQADRKKDLNTEVLLYSDLNQELLTDPGIQAVVAEIRADMEARGWQVLVGLGDTAAASGDADTALNYYQKSLNIKGDNPDVLLKMANIYKGRDEADTANQLYGDIIKNFPDSNEAKAAKEARGY